MPNWEIIWKALHALISILGLSDPKHWKGEVEDTHNRLTVTKVFLNEKGIQFNFTGDPNGVTYVHAKPNLTHFKYMDVFVNGALDPNARLVPRFTTVGFRPVVILTFKNIGGHKYRFDSTN